MSTQLIEAPEALSSQPSTDRPTDGAVLLLLATEGLAEERSLLAAASLVLDRAVRESDLEPLLRAGLVVRRSTHLALRDDRAVTAALDAEAPSAVAEAHAAWATVLAGDVLKRARHEAMAHVVPNPAAARRARSAGLRYQIAARHNDAIDLFDRAAWLSQDPDESAEILTQGAACAYAAGLWGRASELLIAARRIGPCGGTGRVIDILEAAFRHSGRVPGSWKQQVEATNLLLEWGQPEAAFAILAASSAGVWDDTLGTLVGTTSSGLPIPSFGRAGELALDGLVALRAGAVSQSLPVLQRAAQQLESRDERGAATIAHALVGEAAACLGQIPTATVALARAGQLSLETDQGRWLDRADLMTGLLSIRRGEGVPHGDDVMHRALLSGCPSHRDRAELVQGVDLLAHERWVEGYDVLVALMDPAHTSTRDLVAWGLLSHFADSALHADRVPRARALISTLAETDERFENDIALAELLYATAVLSDPAHADACYEALMSHDLGRWPWLGARAHLARGEQLRRTRRAVEARRHLANAERMFKAMGAQPWERRAARELRAAGVRHASPPGETSVALSPQELVIAHMAADGMTNREIGTVLSLSPRTVGAHMYRLFPKLGVSKRIQLASALEG